MQTLKLMVATLCALALLSCKSGNEELAVFKNGKITRNDLKNFYDLSNTKPDENTASVENQARVIENLSIIGIVFLESEKNGLLNSPDYQALKEISEKQVAVDIYRKRFLSKEKNKREMKFAELQMAFVQGDQNSNPNKAKAEKLFSDLSALSNDKEIFKYISENTEEDTRKPIGGLFEPQCLNCSSGNSFLDTFKEGLNSGDNKFHMTFSDNNYYIYRIIKTKSIKSEKVEKYLEEKFNEFKEMATQYKNSAKDDKTKSNADYYGEDGSALENKIKMTTNLFTKKFDDLLWQEETERVMKEEEAEVSQIVRDPALAEKVDETTTLLKTKSLNYTIKNLNDEYAKVETLSQPRANSGSQDKIYFFKNLILPILLFTSGDKFDTIKKEQDYQVRSGLAAKNLSWSFFKKKIQSKEIEISDKELKDNYEAGKVYLYSDPKTKQPKPFEQVKEQIKTEIKNTRLNSEFEKTLSNLKKDYDLKVFPEKLKAGNI